jgi:phosphohistidine phosphatase
MQLYILRHGIAEDARPGRSDSERALTPEGKEKLRRVLDRAKRAGTEPTLILTSPYVRAVETAKLAAQRLECRQALLETDALLPSSSPQAVWEEIRTHQRQEQLLLSGHEPLLSQLVAFLLDAPALQVDMKKGALVRLQLDRFSQEPHAVLVWMLTPKLAGSQTQKI